MDTKNLREQAEQEFMADTPSDDNRKFTELYNVQFSHPPYNDFSRSHNSSELFPVQIVLYTLQK